MRRRALRWSASLVLTLCFVVFGALTASAATAPAKPQSPAKPAAAAPATAAPAETKAPETATAPKKESGKGGMQDPFQDAGKAKASDVRQSDLYGDRLDALQKDVDGLKDRIFRSKARLSLLKETVLRGVLAGSRVILAHRNLMGSGFKLVRVVCTLDGAQIFARNDESGSLDSEDELVFLDGNLPPGPHNVQIEMVYQGHGYGVFSYLSDSTFTSNGSHSFTAPENGAIKILSSGFEEGNLTTEMRDRPAVNWQEQPLDASGRPLPKQRRKSGKSGKPESKKK